MSNKSLTDAKKNKADEFYTQLGDIEAELRHYSAQFSGKVIYCNCDDPFESNFFKYFAMNFNHLKLKKLVATCYVNTTSKHPYKIEIVEVPDVDLVDVELLLKSKNNSLNILAGNGDFRSEECIELLKEADIVVTNPPFSLFREYFAQLIEHDKKFVVIGSMNAITYKDVFKLLKENKIWLGYGFKGGATHFISPYEDTATAGDHKPGMVRVSGVRWFTNLDITKRHETITLYKNYSPEAYPEFDYYNAINVDKVAEIPCDYLGAMGVPITFMDKYNPEQFEILDCNDIRKEGMRLKDNQVIKDKDTAIAGISKYARIVIKRKV